MKTFHLIFFYLMIFFAVLQWNDPDRGNWILIYLAAGILAIIAYFKTCKACIIAWSILLTLSCFIMLLPTLSGVATFINNDDITEFVSSMQDDKPYIEQVREFSGLLIVIVYSIITAMVSYKRK